MKTIKCEICKEKKMQWINDAICIECESKGHDYCDICEEYFETGLGNLVEFKDGWICIGCKDKMKKKKKKGG